MAKTQAKLMTDTPPRMNPSLHLSEKDLPAIKKWQPGQSYSVTLRLKQTGLNKDRYGDKGWNADFEIMSVTPVSDKKSPKKITKPSKFYPRTQPTK